MSLRAEDIPLYLLDRIVTRILDGKRCDRLLQTLLRRIEQLPAVEQELSVRRWVRNFLQVLVESQRPIKTRIASVFLYNIGVSLQFIQEEWRRAECLPWFEPPQVRRASSEHADSTHMSSRRSPDDYLCTTLSLNGSLSHRLSPQPSYHNLIVIQPLKEMKSGHQPVFNVPERVIKVTDSSIQISLSQQLESSASQNNSEAEHNSGETKCLPLLSPLELASLERAHSFRDYSSRPDQSQRHSPEPTQRRPHKRPSRLPQLSTIPLASPPLKTASVFSRLGVMETRSRIKRFKRTDPSSELVDPRAATTNIEEVMMERSDESRTVPVVSQEIHNLNNALDTQFLHDPSPATENFEDTSVTTSTEHQQESFTSEQETVKCMASPTISSMFILSEKKVRLRGDGLWKLTPLTLPVKTLYSDLGIPANLQYARKDPRQRTSNHLLHVKVEPRVVKTTLTTPLAETPPILSELLHMPRFMLSKGAKDQLEENSLASITDGKQASNTAKPLSTSRLKLMLNENCALFQQPISDSPLSDTLTTTLAETPLVPSDLLHMPSSMLNKDAKDELEENILASITDGKQASNISKPLSTSRLKLRLNENCALFQQPLSDTPLAPHVNATLAEKFNPEPTPLDRSYLLNPKFKIRKVPPGSGSSFA